MSAILKRRVSLDRDIYPYELSGLLYAFCILRTDRFDGPDSDFLSCEIRT